MGSNPPLLAVRSWRKGTLKMQVELPPFRSPNPYGQLPRPSPSWCFTDWVDNRRLTSWMDWYRFARRELGYAHGEAVVYANLRSVEDNNKRTVRQQA